MADLGTKAVDDRKCDLMIPGTSIPATTTVEYGSKVTNPFSGREATCQSWIFRGLYPKGCCQLTKEAANLIDSDPAVQSAADGQAKRCARMESARKLMIYTGPGCNQ